MRVLGIGVILDDVGGEETILIKKRMTSKVENIRRLKICFRDIFIYLFFPNFLLILTHVHFPKIFLPPEFLQLMKR